MVPNNNKIQTVEIAAVTEARSGSAKNDPAAARLERRAVVAAAPLQQRITVANRFLFVLGLLPLIHLSWRFANHDLGANPVETLTGQTGLWAMRLLWFTLLITPLRKLTGWHWLVRMRRIPALFGFFYASLHLLTYLLFEQEFDLRAIADDLAKKPYILVGFACFLMLLPLAATSTDTMMKRLGGKNWRNLHRLTYAAAILAALHYLLLVKRDILAPAIYIIVLAILLAARMIRRSNRPMLIPMPPPVSAIKVDSPGKQSPGHTGVAP